MKLMKQLTIALALGAFPALAFGQTLNCEACTHDVPVYMGDGGLIAEADGGPIEDEDSTVMVAWVAACGDVTHYGTLEPDEDGMVMLQFTDSGLVCNAEESHLQIGPVKDGGWFWITDDMNSAVGSLVNHDILDNDKVGIASAGPGVTMTMGRGAVLVKDTATGRLGVLPNILPEPPKPALRKCGYETGGTAASPTYTRVSTNCAVGTGRTLILMTTTDHLTAKTVLIPPGGTVTRPAGAAITVIAALYMDGTGHYTTDPTGNPRLGFPEVGMADRPNASRFRIPGVRWGSSTGAGAWEGGVFSSSTANSSYVVITINSDPSYCNSGLSLPFEVVVVAEMDSGDVVTPAIPLPPDGSGGAGSATFTVVCPDPEPQVF